VAGTPRATLRACCSTPCPDHCAGPQQLLVSVPDATIKTPTFSSTQLRKTSYPAAQYTHPRCVPGIGALPGLATSVTTVVLYPAAAVDNMSMAGSCHAEVTGLYWPIAASRHLRATGAEIGGCEMHRVDS